MCRFVSNMSLLIISHGTRAYIHIHSFPTRRSSDLALSLVAPVRSTTRLPWRIAAARSCSRTFSDTFSRRSEEHTSELQSPCNIVCRLQLEKKKQSNDTDLLF